MKTSSGALPFRPAYGKLGEMRSFFGRCVPLVALTATASKDSIVKIQSSLGMQNRLEIVGDPDKKNIKYHVQAVEKDIPSNFRWLVDLLRKKGIQTPRMVIFFRRIEYMTRLYELLDTELKEKGYVDYNEDRYNDDRNRLFDMFHLKTDQEVKDTICQSYMDEMGCTRVVMCSTSFSMGLNLKVWI